MWKSTDAPSNGEDDYEFWCDMLPVSSVELTVIKPARNQRKHHALKAEMKTHKLLFVVPEKGHVLLLIWSFADSVVLLSHSWDINSYPKRLPWTEIFESVNQEDVHITLFTVPTFAYISFCAEFWSIWMDSPSFFTQQVDRRVFVPHKFSLADTIHTSYVDCMSYTRCRHLWAPTSRDHNCIATKIERKVSCLLQQHIRRGSSVEHTCRILMKQTGHCSQVAQFFNTLQIIIGFRA